MSDWLTPTHVTKQKGCSFHVQYSNVMECPFNVMAFPITVTVQYGVPNNVVALPLKGQAH